MDVDKRIKLSPGLLISLFVVLVPSFAWMIGFDFSGNTTPEIIGIIMKKTAAFGGMAMFAWSLVLSGRYKIFDRLFNGLDKVYVAHRFFGTAAIALLLLHPLGYTILFLLDNGTNGIFYHFLGYKSLGYTLGRVSLYGLILLGLWSILARVKHETFIKLHRWLGVLFVVGAIHAFMAGPDSVLGSNSFMWWFMMLLTLAATFTYIHYSLLADKLHPYYKYKVAEVKELAGDVVSITIEPKYRIAGFRPGQFFYVAFDDIDEEEYHPFSVASSSTSAKMRFLVKELGDYTKKLKDLKPGTTARLKGPYGGFTFDDKKHDKQLWLAGGIGVTPFLSKALSLQYSKLSPNVTMFHFTRSEKDAIDTEILNIIEEKHPAFDYVNVTQEKFGIVSFKDISEQLGDLHDFAIYVCGPPAMLKAYEQEAHELGLGSQLHYEEFDY